MVKYAAESEEGRKYAKDLGKAYRLNEKGRLRINDRIAIGRELLTTSNPNLSLSGLPGLLEYANELLTEAEGKCCPKDTPVAEVTYATKTFLFVRAHGDS